MSKMLGFCLAGSKISSESSANEICGSMLSHIQWAGLIARYAAMYGKTDIPAGVLKPNWSGARDLNKIFLLGTPNEGSVSAVDGLLNGFSYVGGGFNLPFVQNISRFDLFTIPAIYQLLPHDGTLKAYDENLKPISLDIYDPVRGKPIIGAFGRTKITRKSSLPRNKETSKAISGPFF